MNRDAIFHDSTALILMKSLLLSHYGIIRLLYLSQDWELSDVWNHVFSLVCLQDLEQGNK